MRTVASVKDTSKSLSNGKNHLSPRRPYSLRLIFCCILVFRIVNALLVETYLVADEQWQSLEVAMHKVFGAANNALTWEWLAKIRSSVFPYIFALNYTVIKMLGLHTNQTVMVSSITT